MGKKAVYWKSPLYKNKTNKKGEKNEKKRGSSSVHALSYKL